MANNVFTMDGIDYNIDVLKLTRNFEVADSDETGRTADWNMHRDVVGTFYNYTIEVAVKNFDYDSYDAFYQAISAPVVSHNMVFPYGGTTISFKAYATKGKDTLKRLYQGKGLWDGLSVNFIAMSPQRRT